ncbi:MAG: hypothetical protein HGA53_07715 [Anaerolineaceae bacterium]|nr:hypothetical protein [Anaerolineaceae bacterium]
MDAFNFSGRTLLPGDLLFSLQEGEFTTLYAANEGNGFVPEVVAVLPGRVAAFFPWPDRSGLDYVTSLPNDDMYLPKARLFSLKLDGSQPVQVLPTLPYLTWPRWSFDGRFVYFETAESGSGVGHRAWVLDSTCRSDPATCQPKAVNLPQEMQLNQAVWSPNAYQLAFHGTSVNGLGEVYRMDFSNEGEISAPVNLSESPQNDEQWMRWLPDGSGLLSTCAFRPDPNQWDVCQVSSQPYSEVVVAQLPAHLVPTDFGVLPDGSGLIDRYAENGKAGEIRLVLFSLVDSSMTTLSSGGNFGLLALDGAGGQLAAIRYSRSREMVKEGPKQATEIFESIKLEVLGIVDGNKRTIFVLTREDQLQERGISWLYWVK